MHYLVYPTIILDQIAKFSSDKILWIDTETADWQTSNPKISLIQVLADPTDLTGDNSYIFDVLNKPELVTYFVNQIMANPEIEKVFHNSTYDVRFLGKELAKNVTCTWKMARKLKKKSAEIKLLPNLKLKTLSEELCNFSNVDKSEQSSDWGRRPLSDKQLQYAKMDTVYLAQVHLRLLEIYNLNKPEPVHNSKQESFSVTKVRVAFECPRLFYLAHRFGGKTMFLPANYPKGIGSSFHKLAEEFIHIAKQEPQFQALFEPPVEQLNEEVISSEMQQLFYQLKFFPYLQTTIKENPAQAMALPQIWQALIQLIKHWAKLLVKNRQYCLADAVISNTLISGELKLEHEFTLPDGSQQKIIGKLDSLVRDYEKQRLCVVEFKTYHPLDPSTQLAQVALYSYLLWQNTKVPVDSAVYCVLPEFKEYHYSWEQLENTVHQLTPYKLQQMQKWLTWEPPQPNPPPSTTQPHLCEICPQQEKCQTYFESPKESVAELGYEILGAISSPSLQPWLPQMLTQEVAIEPEFNHNQEFTQPGQEGNSEADELGKQLVETLQSFKVDVDYLGATVGSTFIRVKLKPNLGVKVASLLKLAADIQVQLGIANPPLIAPQAGYVSVDLPRQNRQTAVFEDYIKPQKTPNDAPVKIAIGIDLNGQLIEADLSNPNTCHFLVGGTTGSGKSEFLRSLLLSLLYRHSPQQLKIALVDPKRVTFPEFEQMPWLHSPVVKDSENAIALMTELVAEMQQRYQRFEAAGSPHLTAYNAILTQKQQPSLPRIVCIFDEYADFMAEKDTRKELELSIKRLGAMARAAGIHLIIATQRPEAGIVTPIIRSNLPGRIALRTASIADSKIVLGGTQIEAAYLLGKGDLLYQANAQLIRLQSLFAAKIQLPR
jgi:DNA segregation ATPase FtsK/SpoIIIE, S-DNA-T family